MRIILSLSALFLSINLLALPLEDTPLDYPKTFSNGSFFALQYLNIAKKEIDNNEPELALPWLIKSAKKENPEAQFLLASAYRFGSGTGVNTKESLYWMELSAKSGMRDAQYDLGIMYGYIPEIIDLEKSDYWIKQAALQNLPIAFWMLGSKYLVGDEVEKDIEKAVIYLKKAVKGGARIALSDLIWLYSIEDGYIDPNQASYYADILLAQDNFTLNELRSIATFYALNGDFSTAIKYQNLALDKASPDYIDIIKSNLESYKNNEFPKY